MSAEEKKGRSFDYYIIDEQHFLEDREMPVGRWIPVSKGLPELEYDGVFEGTDCFSSDTVLVTLADGSVTAAYCSVNKEQDEEFVEWVSVKDNLLNVIAWMPFPDPYEEDE